MQRTLNRTLTRQMTQRRCQGARLECGSNPPPDPAMLGVLVFRGLRIKCGLDYGQVAATVHPAIGRMTYRGRTMNRAARVCSAAKTGQVWASRNAWCACLAEQVGGAADPGVSFTPMAPSLRHDTDMQPQSFPSVFDITATPMGPHKLKGVHGEVELVHCQFQLEAKANLSYLQLLGQGSTERALSMSGEVDTVVG